MTEDYEEWSVWRNYDDLTVVVQKEGRHDVHLLPDEARAKVRQMEQAAEQRGLTMDETTKAFHQKILEYADEIDQLRKEKSQ